MAWSVHNLYGNKDEIFSWLCAALTINAYQTVGNSAQQYWCSDPIVQACMPCPVCYFSGVRIFLIYFRRRQEPSDSNPTVQINCGTVHLLPLAKVGLSRRTPTMPCSPRLPASPPARSASACRSRANNLSTPCTPNPPPFLHRPWLDQYVEHFHGSSPSLKPTWTRCMRRLKEGYFSAGDV